MTESFPNGWDYRKLAGWIPQPTVLNRVLEYMQRVERPQRTGEVARALDLSPWRADRSLGRLTHKGLLERWKAPMVVSKKPGGFRRTTQVHMTVWLYALARKAEDAP